MYEVIIKTGFSAAHQLRYYDGKYENLHGHNWTVIVTVETKDLDEIGLGIDFIDISKLYHCGDEGVITHCCGTELNTQYDYPSHYLCHLSILARAMGIKSINAFLYNIK